MSKQAASEENEESTSQKPNNEQLSIRKLRDSSQSSQEGKSVKNENSHKKRSRRRVASCRIPKEDQSQRDITRNSQPPDNLQSRRKECDCSAAVLHRQEKQLKGTPKNQKQKIPRDADDAECSVRADGTAGHPVTQRPSVTAVNTEKTESEHACCSAGCYIFCPPVPSQITRKLAFHPPKRGKFYRLKYVTAAGNEVEVSSAKEAFGKKQLKFDAIAESKGMEIYVKMAMQDSETFILRTKRKNYIVCLWFKSPAVVNDKVILFAQANATDLGMFTHIDINFHELAVEMETDVYSFDYSGYGFSTGTPSEKNIYEDIRTVYNYICRARPNMKIILMGFSMGTASSIDLASKQLEMLAGVVLISPFASGLRLVRSKPEKETTNCCDPFQSIDKAKSIKVPTLLVHGGMDDVVPIKHSVELHKRLRKPVEPLYISQANHSNVMSHKFPEFMARIRHFVHHEI